MKRLAAYKIAAGHGHDLQTLPATHDERGTYTKTCTHAGCEALVRIENLVPERADGLDQPCPYARDPARLWVAPWTRT